ncbi:putative ABC transporter ATP-binding protein [Candidatus Izimaplasma bacterium HR1]|jgi:ATP-binding cassette subfamily B protein|uniref:ABC transporter ATP-binding protein n=1 Tax=Candidatus Izimoplasma sp. HR1 TaxID=1541959 RepID=UPI0004F8164E|nr:putative ABC transporter ATP-binding protein [Candidatus Izimaplasma bacterium HR1]
MPRKIGDSDDKRLNTMKDGDIIKRLLKYAIPFTRQFVIVFIFMIATVMFGIFEPILLGKSIDIIVYDFDLDNLLKYLSILVGIIIVGNVFNYIQTIMLNTIGQGVIYNIREEIFTHLEHHDIAYINSRPTGSLVTRVTNDTNTLNEMYTSVIISVFKNVMMIIGILIAMFVIDATLTLYVLIVIPFIILFSFLFRILSRRAYREVRSNLSKVNAFLAEHLSGMKIIQIFNKEAVKFKQFDERNAKLKRSYYKQITIFGIYRPTMYLLFMIATIIVFYFGSESVLNNVITIGVLLTFYQFIGRFFEPIQQLAEQFNILQSAFASSERIFGILDSKPTVADKENAIDLTDMKGEIEFRNVWFKYVEDEWVLKNVSFKVKAKESVAFVGATGAGKTTILGLITRNYDIQQGQILIDGIDITAVSKKTLRKYIGQMLQDVFMFSGTIRSNIKLRNEEITDEEMIKACEYVNATHFINKLDNTFDEEVRERGNNFSSGQRQLLSFARTIVHSPKVMILDEATSNIDTETEQLIQESLYKMMSIGTMLIVAHRLSTIQHVDKIIVLSKGEIIESGNHQELLKERGHYYNLYRIQYQDQSKNDIK